MLTRRRASDTSILTIRRAEYLSAARSVAALVAPGACADRAGPTLSVCFLAPTCPVQLCSNV